MHRTKAILKLISSQFNKIIDHISDFLSTDINDLENLKNVARKVIFLLFITWLVVLSFGLIFSIFKKPETLGLIGDSLNIITSLAGVFTVGLLAYAVYLQKTELNAVKRQIEDQTKSTEDEQRKNRTFKKFEEWDKASIIDRTIRLKNLPDEDIHSGIWYLDDKSRKEYDLFIYSERWEYIEQLIESSIFQEKTYKSYINFDELLAYVLSGNIFKELLRMEKISGLWAEELLNYIVIENEKIFNDIRVNPTEALRPDHQLKVYENRKIRRQLDYFKESGLINYKALRADPKLKMNLAAPLKNSYL